MSDSENLLLEESDLNVNEHDFQAEKGKEMSKNDDNTENNNNNLENEYEDQFEVEDDNENLEEEEQDLFEDEEVHNVRLNVTIMACFPVETDDLQTESPSKQPRITEGPKPIVNVLFSK